MSSVSVGVVPSERWMPVSMSLFAEGISHLLHRWYSLQWVVAAETGMQTPDIPGYLMSQSSPPKSEKVDQLSADIFDWFTQPKELHDGNSLATMLDKKIRHSFGMPVGDGTVGKVKLISDKEDGLKCRIKRQAFYTYMDGERLTAEDEKAVVEKLLTYHPHSEDKIGSGLDSIMVDRHPQFRNSRCLFVVRTDGGWMDFSYQKCIRAYIRDKYPSYAERFIREHFKRSSG